MKIDLIDLNNVKVEISQNIIKDYKLNLYIRSK